jgi:hypothetical protein
MKANETTAFNLLPTLTATLPMSTADIKRLLQQKVKVPPPILTQNHPKPTSPLIVPVPEISPPIQSVPNVIPNATIVDKMDDCDYTLPNEPQTAPPRLTKLMNPEFFNKSVISTAWQAQREQKFCKDNLRQVFTTERVIPHIVSPLLKGGGFLDSDDMSNLFGAMPSTCTLWNEYQRVKDLDWTALCQPNPNWKEQTEIDDHRVDMRTAMLFHYDLDLAAVHRKIGGNHVGAHRNPEIILCQVEGLLDWKTYKHLCCILCEGCPHVFNEEATHDQ